MKRFIAIVFLVLFCVPVGPAQSKSRALVLEAHMLGIGMVSPQGRHLYLRIYSDRWVEYEDERMKGSRLDYFIRRAKLSVAEFKDLSDYLNGSNVRAVAKVYPPLEPPLDHVFELTVSITRADQIQSIIIGNFSPTSPQAGEAYPTGLIELLCRIERLRKNASFGITADVTKWCRQ